MNEIVNASTVFGTSVAPVSVVRSSQPVTFTLPAKPLQISGACRIHNERCLGAYRKEPDPAARRQYQGAGHGRTDVVRSRE